jgi:hypothetical protein
MEWYWVAGAVAWLLLIGLGVYVAGVKGRSPREGAVLAAVFGPLGVVVVALLPTIDDEEEMARLKSR